MGWDSIRWDQNQLETSIGQGFLSQFPFVNLSLENEFWDWMLLTLVKSPIIACNCTLRNFPDLVFGRVAHLNWEYSSSGFMQDLFSGVHIYHISTEEEECESECNWCLDKPYYVTQSWYRRDPYNPGWRQSVQSVYFLGSVLLKSLPRVLSPSAA